MPGVASRGHHPVPHAGRVHQLVGERALGGAELAAAPRAQP
ncbi:hypothetical protein [Streptomyces fradiae]